MRRAFNRPLVFRILLLAVVLVIAPAACRAQSGQDPMEVALELREAYRLKDWPKAIKLSRKLAEYYPNDTNHLYSLACLYALDNQPAESLSWLRTSAERGYHNVTRVQTDAQLEQVRKLPGYAAVLKLIREKHAEALKELADNVKKVEPVIVLPPGYDPEQPTPLIVALHPYGTNSHWILKRWRSIAAEAGAILAAPQALNPAFTGFEWGQVDEADIMLGRALEVVFKKHKIDKQRTVLTGFSQGSFMAYVLGTKHADIFRGVIPVGGGYDHDLDAPPADAKNLPRYFILIGNQDPALPGNQQAAKDFKAAGARVELQVYEGGHVFPANADEVLKKALEFVWGE